MNSQYFQANFSALAPLACHTSSTPPTFSGITSAVSQSDGSVLVSWSAATGGSANPIRYRIYVMIGSVSGATLFASSAFYVIESGLTSARIYTDASSPPIALVAGSTYTFGIRAADALGNTETNLITATATVTYNLYALVQTVQTQTTASAIAAAVWGAVVATYNTAGSFGAQLQNAVSTVVSIAAGVWNSVRASFVTSGSFGESNQGVISTTRANNLDNLDATISSRAPASTALSTAQWTNTRATLQDNLDATVSSRATQSSVNSIPTNPLLTTDSRLNNLDVTVSSRLPTSGYTAPDNADIAAIKSKTDNLNFDGSNYVNAHTKVNDDKTGYALTSAEEIAIAVSVWAASQGSNATAGSFGAAFQGIITATRANNLDTIPTIASQTTASSVAHAIWDSLTASFATANTFGAALQVAVATPGAISTAVWTALQASNTASGSFGLALQGSPLLTTDSRLNNLDATISSRATGTAVAAIPTTPLLTSDSRLNHLDADISSRLPTSTYVAPDNADIAAIKAKTDNLPSDPASNTELNAVESTLAADIAQVDSDVLKTKALVTATL